MNHRPSAITCPEGRLITDRTVLRTGNICFIARNLHPRKGPRLPSGKVSALGPEGSRFETRFHRRSAVYGACCTLHHTYWPNVLPLLWRGILERACQLRCCPRHLSVAQNYEVRPNIAPVLLQSGTLI
ncbi:hypothetical protein AVEN_274027-1 [Araneus ventricosus]|uniref:Uncharacterized protein n=1 Tax=Araneus ventricosus TaxID=182803 RepID=A0A4Y2W8Z2_ARAVE|nr:hypothetical protein AVEN_274027-1 [Araneus ventricosus]